MGYIKEQDFNGRLEEIFLRKQFQKTGINRPHLFPYLKAYGSKCPKCGEMVYREDVISNAYVCPKCGGYFRISANAGSK